MRCLLWKAFTLVSILPYFITEQRASLKKKLLICYKFNYSQSNTVCSLAGNSIVIIIVIIATVLNISIKFFPSNNTNVVKYSACY